MNTRRLPRIALLATFLVGAAACDDYSTPTDIEPQASRQGAQPEPAGPTIADIAIAAASDATNPEFTILVQALVAADLAGTFDGRRQFTVFAPTDAAFGRLLGLLGITAEELLANTDLLTQVLLYHVAPGRRLSGDVLTSDRIRTLNGAFVYPTITSEGAFIVDDSDATEDAQLLAPDLIDIEASNGVIHVIDEVLVF